jgi:mannose-1-phosphate guanylyltransferase
MACELFKTIDKAWGHYVALHDGHDFCLRKIVIYPNQSTPFKINYLRQETWIIVSGVATLIFNDSSYQLKENKSFFVPEDESYKISNDTTSNICLIVIRKKRDEDPYNYYRR